MRDLAQGAGLTVPEEQVSADEQVRRDKLRERRLSMGEVLTKAADFYRGQLRASPRAIDYLKRRGLTGAIAARFGLGYAPPGWRTLAGVFPRYDDPLLEEAGLVRAKDAEDGATADADRGRYDWFRDRVMFPDPRGAAARSSASAGACSTTASRSTSTRPRRRCSARGASSTACSRPARRCARRATRWSSRATWTWWRWRSRASRNAVATLGTACTADHVQKLFRFTDAVVFSFDGDAAGRRAAGRALEASLPHASDLRSVRFLFLPTEHDPDSFVRELGAAGLRSAPWRRPCRCRAS